MAASCYYSSTRLYHGQYTIPCILLSTMAMYMLLLTQSIKSPTQRILCTTFTCNPGTWAIKMSFSYTASPSLRLGSVLSLCTTQYYYTDTVTFTLLAVFRANIFTASPGQGRNIA